MEDSRASPLLKMGSFFERKAKNINTDIPVTLVQRNPVNLLGVWLKCLKLYVCLMQVFFICISWRKLAHYEMSLHSVLLCSNRRGNLASNEIQVPGLHYCSLLWTKTRISYEYKSVVQFLVTSVTSSNSRMFFVKICVCHSERVTVDLGLVGSEPFPVERTLVIANESIAKYRHRLLTSPYTSRV
jgi:hypothetical protein